MAPYEMILKKVSNAVRQASKNQAMVQEMTLKNGFRAVRQTCGNQTTIQIFDEMGELVKTRVKSVAHSTVPPKAAKKTLGFVTEAPQQVKGKVKDVFTITKNDYDHVEQISSASILDRVYVDNKRVGERLLKACGEESDNPMAAMNKLKGKYYDDKENKIVTKILSYFEDGVIQKVTLTEIRDGIRRTRTNCNVTKFALEQETRKIKLKYKDQFEHLREQMIACKKQLKASKKTDEATANKIISEMARLNKEKSLLKSVQQKEIDQMTKLYRETRDAMYESGAFCTVNFNGAKLRADIGGMDFTL